MTVTDPSIFNAEEVEIPNQATQTPEAVLVDDGARVSDRSGQVEMAYKKSENLMLPQKKRHGKYRLP